jgi:hypothetical protein
MWAGNVGLVSNFHIESDGPCDVRVSVAVECKLVRYKANANPRDDLLHPSLSVGFANAPGTSNADVVAP